MELRKYPRIRVHDMTIHISDGIRCCAGAVADVSRFGLRLAEIGSRFGKQVDQFTVVAVSGEQHFKFRVKPRWSQIGPSSKSMGVNIEAAPWQWTSFVQSLEARRRP